MAEPGFPAFASDMAAAVAPFDVISDMLGGTRGTMLDMYRQPDKLLEALIGSSGLDETVPDVAGSEESQFVCNK